MKRQRGVNGVDAMNSLKLEGAGVDVAAVATMGKKKAKIEADQKVKEKVGRSLEEEEKKESKEMGLVGTGENVTSWGNWEENWPWLGGMVDEQMSWGSIWLPVWDMDFMGEAEAFTALNSDVVWEDDIWNLKKQIPNPAERETQL